MLSKKGGILMKEYFPDKRSLTAIKVTLIILAAVVSVISIRYISIKAVSLAVCIITSVLALIFAFIYFPLLFKSMKYTLTDTEIIRTGGVFIKSYESIRFSAIQYTASICTPLSKYTGLNFIVFFVYGGQERLLFLKEADVVEILLVSSGLDKLGGAKNVS